MKDIVLVSILLANKYSHTTHADQLDFCLCIFCSGVCVSRAVYIHERLVAERGANTGTQVAAVARGLTPTSPLKINVQIQTLFVHTIAHSPRVIPFSSYCQNISAERSCRALDPLVLFLLKEGLPFMLGIILCFKRWTSL